jgi:large subunit ribosomal protein L17
LSRSRSQRKALVQSLTQALIQHERIQTTLARAKATQRLAERLITLGKGGTLAKRRHAISLLNDSRLVHRLFVDIAPRYSARNGGYTRIMKLGTRPGDRASLAVIELTELAPELKEEKKKAKKETRSAPQAPKKASTKTAEPEAPKKPKQEKKEASEQQKPASEQQKPEESEKDKEKKGFIGGLRNFFKKDRPQD